MNIDLAEKWLKGLAVIHIIGGLLLPILVFTPFSTFYFEQLGSRFPASNPDSLRFLIGVFGPTVASWGILFYYSVGKAFENRTKKDWWFLVIAILTWGVLDSIFSWFFSIHTHLIINGLFLILFLLPLLKTKVHFK